MSNNQNQDGGQKAVDDLINSVLGGNQQSNEPPVQGGGVEDVLGSILGGAASGGQQQQQGGGMGDVLGSILGGAAGGGQQQQGGGMGDVLGSILGGGQQQQPTQRQPSSGGSGDILGSILGSVLGGGASGGSGNPVMDSLGGILGSVLGGGGIMGAGASVAASPILRPIANMLAEKLGISPTIAMAIVSYAATKILSGALNKGGQSGQRTVPHGARLADVVDQDLLGKMVNGQANQRYIRNTGMVDELMTETGLDRSTATKSLQMVFDQLGTQLQQ